MSHATALLNQISMVIKSTEVAMFAARFDETTYNALGVAKEKLEVARNNVARGIAARAKSRPAR